MAGIKAIVPVDPQIYQNGTLSVSEAASQTFKRGKILTVESDGHVAAATLGSAGTYAYIAAEDGHNGSSDGDYEVLVYPIVAGAKYEFTFGDSLTQTDIGDSIGIANDGTTGYDFLDRDDTDDEVFVVDYVRGPGGAAIGDTNARVLGVFEISFLQFHD